MRTALWSKLILLVVALGLKVGCAAQAAGTGTADQNAAILPCWADLEARDNAACASCIAKAELQWSSPSAVQRGELLALKGALAYATGKMDHAEGFLHEALPLFLQEGRPWPVGLRIYRILGHIAYEQGDHHKAIGYYNNLLALCAQRAPDGTADLGRAHYNIGNCFWGMDQRDSCKAHYAEALRYWQSGGHTGVPVIGYIHEVLGTYAWDEGNEREALAQFNMAGEHQLKNATGTDAADEMARNAETNALFGRDDQALELYQKALDFRAANYGSNHPNTACMHSDIARMLATMGRTGEALVRAQQAIALFVPGFKPADVYSNPASIDSATSCRLLLDALLVKFRMLALDSADSRSQTSADQVIDLSIRAIERLRTGAQAEASKLFWTDHVRGFLEAALQHCHRHFDARDTTAVARLLTIMELGRNALLADALRSLDARSTSGLPDSIAKAERDLREHIIEMRRYILLEEKKCERMDADKVGLWKKAVAAGDADLDLLVSRIARDYPAYHALKYATSDIRYGEVMRRLGRDRSLLCMFQGNDALYLLLLDDRGARFVEQERMTDLGNATVGLRGALRDRTFQLSDPQGAYDLFAQNAALLYELVFRDLEPAPYEHVAIMPDGAFHYLPFDVFLTAHPPPGTRDYKNLPYLINDHSVHVVTMLRQWLRGPVVQEADRVPYLGFAPTYDVEGPTRLLPLRSNVAEVTSAQSLLGGLTFTGAQANEQVFKRKAGSSTVLHLAMHTVMDEVEPLQSALAFGHGDSTDDGFLFMHELFGMELHARLALLSACNTGDGPMLQGEGISSLARAFAYTGCPSVVMNLWPCDDEVSGSIIASLCEGIADRTPLDDALREAKLKHLRTCDPTKAHPFYWSTLVLLGDERAIDLRAPWYRRPLVWVLAGTVLLILFVRLRSAKRA